jgi:hypothetical protein
MNSVRTRSAARCIGATAAGVLVLALPWIACAQQADSRFWTTNGTVNATALSGNTLYIGGDFDYVGPYTGGGVPLGAATGVVLPGFPSVHGTLSTVVGDGNGGWFIGGLFDSVGGLPRTNVAHIQSDFTVSGWAPDANGVVNAMALAGSTVYAGGSFTSIGGQMRNNIAELDATTGLATNWNPNANAQVFVVAVNNLRLNQVYVGGAFTTIGGQPRNRIAALNTSDGLAASWNPNASDWVRCLATSGPLVYAGGTFTSINGQTRRGIAAIDVTTGLPSSWNPSAHNSVYALAVKGPVVYAGGTFDSIGGQARANIAAIDSTTGLATSWSPNATGTVDALLVNGSTVYVGGDFYNIGGQARRQIAALDATTGLATSWNPSASTTVLALALSGTTLFAGGDFTSVGGQTRRRIAALDVTTGLLTSWDPNAGGPVFALAVSDTTVYAGGNFTSIGGQTRIRIAAISTTSGLATAWNPSATNTVQALAISDSTVYAGGVFVSIGGQTRRRIAALSASTGLATAWNPDASAIVNCLAVSGTTVYAGGYFTSIGGLARNRIAALSASTGLATSWSPNSNNIVNSLAVRGSTVYAGGFFTSIGGQTRNRIAALDSVTGLARSWNPGADGSVFALAVSGSTVYAGGNFFNIDAQPHNSIAAIDATTGVASAWDPDADVTVLALTVSGSTVYAGGSFTRMGGVHGLGIAAISALLGISRIEPSHGGNGGAVTAVLTGVGFQSGATAKFTRSGQPDIIGAQVTIDAGGDSLAATFDLTGRSEGVWDVIVTNPDASFAVLPQGFTIGPEVAPQLRVNVLGPGLIRYNHRTAFDLVIENPGNVDALSVPLWITGVPTDATFELDLALAYPPQSGGEPDWTTVPLGFSSPGGRYFTVVIPRVPPGTTVRRVYLTVPQTITAFLLRAAITPGWIDGNKFRACLTATGAISNAACMGAQLTAINTYLAANPSFEALSGIGVWAKIAWQCEGAVTLPLALTKAEQVLDAMVGPVELPGSQMATCTDVLPPRWRDSLLVTVAGSIDPNDKLGPRDSLSVQQAIPYSIRFENSSAAMLPAQQVVISDPLDVTKLDPNTVSLDVITFGSVHVVPPPGLKSYATQVDLRPGLNLLVNVSAGVDPFTGVVTWYFTSIDPATHQPPTNPLSGFLPPNVTPPEGEGSVLFTVMPRPTLSSGTTISNSAVITFDTNPPQNTDAWVNTVDNNPPGSHVLPLTATSDLPSIPVSWTPDGSSQDLRDYTVFVSEDGAPYRVWRLNVAAANDTLVPPGNHQLHTYAFYSVARDIHGNIETAPTSADATTQSRTAVGDGAVPLALALEGARPNPATGPIWVWFTLPSRERATLDVIDVAGRRVIRREVGSLGPGPHSLLLDRPTPLPPALYFLRLAQGPRVLTSRIVVVQ